MIFILKILNVKVLTFIFAVTIYLKVTYTNRVNYQYEIDRFYNRRATSR